MPPVNSIAPSGAPYAASYANNAQPTPKAQGGAKNMLPKLNLRNPKPAPVKVSTETYVQPLKKSTASFLSGLVNLFSFKSIKSVGSKGLLVGTGIAGGAALAIFAGPQIHAAFVGLALSSAFPPVMIAIGATLGAALLAFGIYKLVKYSQARLAADKAAKEALAAQQAEAAGNVPAYGAPELQQPITPFPPQYNPAAVPQQPGVPGGNGVPGNVQFQMPQQAIPPLAPAVGYDAASLNEQNKWQN